MNESPTDNFDLAFRQYREKLKAHQDPALAVVSGAVAALLAAAGAAYLAFHGEFRATYLAPLLALLVATVIRVFGKGYQALFSLVGIVCSALAVLGSILGVEVLRRHSMDKASIDEVLAGSGEWGLATIRADYQASDLLIYILGVVLAYYFSQRSISMAEVRRLRTELDPGRSTPE